MTLRKDVTACQMYALGKKQLNGFSRGVCVCVLGVGGGEVR